ncbi:MAG: hypothetical protein HQL55_01105 [Magnetococcales bacterium]|nr:hypothetical protein [Magnetococcales bacterium]
MSVSNVISKFSIVITLAAQVTNFALADSEDIVKICGPLLIQTEIESTTRIDYHQAFRNKFCSDKSRDAKKVPVLTEMLLLKVYQLGLVQVKALLKLQKKASAMIPV